MLLKRLQQIFSRIKMADARAHLETALEALARGDDSAREPALCALNELITELKGEAENRAIVQPVAEELAAEKRKRGKRAAEKTAEARPKKVMNEDQLAVLKERLAKARENKARKRADAAASAAPKTEIAAAA